MTKIGSWNVNSLNVRKNQVIDYFKNNDLDILGLQELKQEDAAIDKKAFLDAGWYLETFGQKTYNGVALLSKTPPENVVRGIPDYHDPAARAIAASYGAMRVLNLYVPNGKAVFDEKFHYKLEWLQHVQRYIAHLCAHYPHLVVIGDFNIAPTDRDVFDPRQFQEKLLCSDAERRALHALFALGLRDSFREMHPEKTQFSWWDYRYNAWQRNLGLRIDLVLISSGLRLIAADIDTQTRQNERPSDHSVVWAQVENPSGESA